MSTLGYVTPVGQQSKEGFHALRRTTEGLLYYTKTDKDSTDTIDDGRPTESERWMWSPTDGLVRIKRTPVPKKNGEG